jgi:hypothetical protein
MSNSYSLFIHIIINIVVEILRLLMPGIQTHIGSSDHKVRRLGMYVAEVVTAAIDPEGPKLNFEVGQTFYL